MSWHPSVCLEQTTNPGFVAAPIISPAGALNGAAFEWIQHEPIGCDAVLMVAQPYVDESMREVRGGGRMLNTRVEEECSSKGLSLI